MPLGLYAGLAQQVFQLLAALASRLTRAEEQFAAPVHIADRAQGRLHGHDVRQAVPHLPTVFELLDDAVADVGAVEQRHDDGLRTDDGSQLLHGRLQVVTLRAAEDVIGRDAELLRLLYDALRTHAKRALRGLHLQPVPSNLQPVLSSGDEIHLNVSVGCIGARQHAAKISADASYTCDYNSLHNK